MKDENSDRDGSTEPHICVPLFFVDITAGLNSNYVDDA